MEINTVLQVDGVGHDGVLCTVDAHLCHDAFVDCSGEYETTVVVGVLTDEVNTSWRCIDTACLTVEMLDETTSYFFNCYHNSWFF